MTHKIDVINQSDMKMEYSWVEQAKTEISLALFIRGCGLVFEFYSLVVIRSYEVYCIDCTVKSVFYQVIESKPLIDTINTTPTMLPHLNGLVHKFQPLKIPRGIWSR